MLTQHLSTRPMSGCLCGPAPLSSPRCPVSTPAWLCIIGHEFLLPALTPELGQTVNNNVSGSHRSQGGRLTVSKQLCACFIACYWSIMVSGWRSWKKRWASNWAMTRLTTLLLESEKWLLKGRDQFNITLLATSRDNSTLRSELWNEGSIVKCSGQWCGGNGDSYPQIFGPVWIHFRYLQYWPWTMGSEPPPRTGTWLLTNGIIIVACVVPKIRYTNLIKVPSHLLISINKSLMKSLW